MALIDEKERNWAEREHDYQRQIIESREMVKELKVSHKAASARLNAQDQKFGSHLGQFRGDLQRNVAAGEIADNCQMATTTPMMMEILCNAVSH